MATGIAVKAPWYVTAVLTCLTCISCHNEQVTPSEMAAQRGAISGSLRARYKTVNDQYAELADRIPGFAGMYYDSTGRLNILMKWPSIHAAARPIIADFLRRRVKRDIVRMAKTNFDVSNAQIRKVEHDFRELLDWYYSRVSPRSS